MAIPVTTARPRAVAASNSRVRGGTATTSTTSAAGGDPRDVDGQRVVAVDPERRGVDDDIEAGRITKGTGVDGTGRGRPPHRLGERIGVGSTAVRNREVADARQGQRDGNGLGYTARTDQEHPARAAEVTMHRNGLDHSDTVEGFPDHPAIRVDPDSVDDATGLGVREQHVAQLGDRSLVGHGHAEAGKVPQPPHPAIAEATQRTVDALSARWTDVPEIPVYPAFRTPHATSS